MTPEGRVQRHGRRRFKAKGALCRKISYEGRIGAPDYMYIIPARWVNKVWVEACILFVEYKKDAETPPAPHQIREHKRMRAKGADVRVVGTIQEVDMLIREFFGCD